MYGGGAANNCRRCTICGINYPTTVEDCPIHGTKAVLLFSTPPDADWEEQMVAIETQLKSAEAEARDLIPAVEATVREQNGQLFVSRISVGNSLSRYNLQAGALFRIDDQVYEVLGQNEESREYWVQPFSLTLSDEELALLADGQQ